MASDAELAPASGAAVGRALELLVRPVAVVAGGEPTRLGRAGLTHRGADALVGVDSTTDTVDLHLLRLGLVLVLARLALAGHFDHTP